LSTVLLGRSLGGDGLRLDRADNDFGGARERDEIELHTEALAVAVRPRGTDFEPGALLKG
jgi:hypothetical protein